MDWADVRGSRGRRLSDSRVEHPGGASGRPRQLAGLPVQLDRKAWLLKVASLADRDRSDWVVRARDPQARLNRKALDRLSETAPIGAEIVPLLGSISMDLMNFGSDHITFMGRVQEAHPGDFWANFRWRPSWSTRSAMKKRSASPRPRSASGRTSASAMTVSGRP